ncbi:hypothetical protein KAFR_0C03480 [Kazachstania africana CBS 2517]|uniref:Protein kinase domain-containing protein n=1 Tax=Kazachstania africana (strain ATCC 22294 / BCRC 22015 / CBS 2517 / CECT 1963 / NBRC 1671 / NRRL Y-8276) TaxID=1071382 RepID=H2ASJ0_KAZAF|nr:hypothetical protein KAFR_0C03480 [Kazachstania africana CBS 2517]CCF57340.1 hypothetical protein KAFR_0C03480 [Kazachstania africana CBS 2517]
MNKLDQIDNGDKKLYKSTKFACIYKVKDIYAIKTVPVDFNAPPHNHKRELKILQDFNKIEESDKYIVKLLDYKLVDDELQFLLPFVPLTLHDFMSSQYKSHKKRYNPYYSTAETESPEKKYTNGFEVKTLLVPFLTQIIKAVNFVHKQKIIHRDIKPQNIMYQPNDNSLKLIDFGISYDYNDTQQLVTEPSSEKITDVSTSFYKAPELLFGVKNYDFKIDIWSVLVIASQWLQSEKLGNDFMVLPAMFDDGSGYLENGSDIRLILSIFDQLGVPSLDGWNELRDFGSADAFAGLFGEQGNGNYILDQEYSTQVGRMIEMLPKLNEIDDVKLKNKLVDLFLKMIPLQSKDRWDTGRLLQVLETL